MAGHPLRRALADCVAGVAAGEYAARLRSPGRVRWRPPAGDVVTTSTLSARVLPGPGSPVVLLHGLVASGIYWGAAYDALAPGHFLVVPDLLGFGHSPRPGSAGPDDHVDALVACLDELGISGPVTIGAHSLGTLVAIRLAATHPDRVRSVVAFGPPLYPNRTSARSHVAGTSPMGRLFVLPGRSAARACRWACDHRRISAGLAVLTHPGLPGAIAAASTQHTWETYSHTLARLILDNGAPSWLRRVVCPVRLVAGAADRVVDHEFLASTAAHHAGVTAETWPGGHDLPLARPDECVLAIGRACDQVAPAPPADIATRGEPPP